MPRIDYTVSDSAGRQVQKGDSVTLTITGEVRSVSRDGLVMIKTPDGTITGFFPQYQKMHKLETGV